MEYELYVLQFQESMCKKCTTICVFLSQKRRLICSTHALDLGIKQLETFNDMNEKFVQLLNMIPDPKVSSLLQCIAIISAT
jgi:hypothetical protein